MDGITPVAPSEPNETNEPEALASQAPDDQGAEAAAYTEDGPVLSWRAQEYIHHEKGHTWSFGLWVVVAVLCGGAAFLKQWFSLVVFVVMGAALTVYGHRRPQELEYSLSPLGLNVGEKFHAYSLFKSFSFLDGEFPALELEPNKRFMPRLSLMGTPEDLTQAVEVLADHLPRVDRQPDAIENLTQRLKF